MPNPRHEIVAVKTDEYDRNQSGTLCGISSLHHPIDPQFAEQVMLHEWGCDLSKGFTSYEKRLRKYLREWMFVRDNRTIEPGMVSKRTCWDEYPGLCKKKDAA